MTWRDWASLAIMAALCAVLAWRIPARESRLMIAAVFLTACALVALR